METNFTFKLSKLRGIHLDDSQPLILSANHVSQNGFFRHSVAASEFLLPKKSDMRKMTLSKSSTKARRRGQNFFLADFSPFPPEGAAQREIFFKSS